MSSTSDGSERLENPHPLGFAVLPVHVLLDPDLSATDVRVLLALSSFVGGPGGSCYPSLRTISARAGGITKRQLARVFNGYSSGGQRNPGLVERGYVEVQVRAPRSNVYTLRFDRWGPKKEGDKNVAPASPSDPDTHDRVTPTPVSPSYIEKEQDHRNNTPPNPPQAGGQDMTAKAPNGRRLTRDERKLYEHFDKVSRSALPHDGSCLYCSERIDTSGEWTVSVADDGRLRRLAPAVIPVPAPPTVTICGDLEPLEGSPSDETLRAWSEVLEEILPKLRASDLRYWIKPLRPLRITQGEDGRELLELAAPDEAHAVWTSRLLEEKEGAGYSIDNRELGVQVGVEKHEWHVEEDSGAHFDCAPLEERQKWTGR